MHTRVGDCRVASLPDIWVTETNARAVPVNTLSLHPFQRHAFIQFISKQRSKAQPKAMFPRLEQRVKSDFFIWCRRLSIRLRGLGSDVPHLPFRIITSVAARENTQPDTHTHTHRRPPTDESPVTKVKRLRKWLTDRQWSTTGDSIRNQFEGN